MNTTVKYTITLEGNDIDTKKVQKLKPGAPLTVKRVDDAEDTYEICLCHTDGREIDMLTYAESIGIAPFMDSGAVTAAATVAGVTVKPGKSRAKDLTILTVNVEYSGEELEIFTGKNGVGFIDRDDIVLTLTTIAVLNGDRDMLADRPYLNLYTLSLPIDNSIRDEFECELVAEENYTLEIKALFNEKFTKCKISSFITNSNNEEFEKVELDEEEKQTVLTFINHARIFEGEEGINPETEE